MSRIFISHSSLNNAEARAIRDWLIANSWNDYFLDLDPERGIVAGERWERALHEAANRCQAVLFLVSKGWLASDWCEKEMMLAHKLDKPMFGVIVDQDVSIAALPPKLTAYWQAVDLAKGRDHVLIPTASEDRAEEAHITFSGSGLRRLKAGLDRAGLDPGFFAWPPKEDSCRSPYRGLKPLEDIDAGIFFGRDAQIVAALDRLRGLREATPPRLFVILGASGAGKSSFLRAGILPRLARDDRRFLVLPPIRSAFGALHGQAGLVAALDGTMARTGLKKDRAAIRQTVESGGSALADLVQEMCAKARPPASPGDPDLGPPALVIPIDQGEELFAGDAPKETATFLDRLTELLEPQGAGSAKDRVGALAIVTIRSDAYERLQTSPTFGGLAHTPYSLGPMTEANYRDVVTGPAKVLAENTGRKLELKADFVDTLLQDVIRDGGVDKLPLLAFAMERMFLDYGGDDVITLEEYRQSGGIGGAVEKAVEEALAEAAGKPGVAAERDAVFAVLRKTLIPHLAVVDTATRQPIACPAFRDELPVDGLPLVDALVGKRLLLSGSTPEGGGSRLQIAHEALLRQWQPMKQWLSEDGEAIAMLLGAAAAACEWSDRGGPSDWLQHSGTRLERTREQAIRSELASLVDDQTEAYLAACKARDEAAMAEKEAAEAEKEAAFERQLAIARIAEQNEAKAVERETIALASLSTVASQRGQYRDALMLALAAWPRRSDPNRPMLRRVFRAYSEALPKARERLRLRHPEPVGSAAFSANGTRILTVSRDCAARIWDAATGNPVGEPMKHDDFVAFAAFSLQGARVVTASDATLRVWDAATCTLVDKPIRYAGYVKSVAFLANGTRVLTESGGIARVWDAATGAPIGEPVKHGGGVNFIALSPDGTRVATAFSDGTARVWDAATGVPVCEPMRHKSTVIFAAFSQDGTRVVTGASGGTAHIWNTATGAAVGKPMKHGYDNVPSAAFSSDGSRVVTASSDGTARVWDAATGAPVGQPMKHEGWVKSAAFSPGGTRVVTASSDAARVWDAATGAPICEPMKHEDAVNSVAFSPDGTRVVTASSDRTARIWDAATGAAVGEPMKHGHDAVNSVAFSRDGTRIVTASSDHTARVWDAATGAAVGAPMKHKDEVTSAAFSRDGASVVTASHDSTARVWDAESGAPVGAPMKHEGWVSSAAFSRDGMRVVTASWDDTARVWNVAAGAPTGEPMKHEGVVHSAAFSQDGTRVVTASGDATARVWDAETGAPVGAPMKHERWVNSAAFSRDGTRVVTASSDRTARVWDAATGAPVSEPMSHEDGVHSAAFSRDGTRVVTSSDDKAARVWDAATGAPVGEPMRHRGVVRCAAFSRDGTRVVTSSDDKTVRVWDAVTGAPAGEPMKHEYGVKSAAFSEDGTRVVTASSDSTARIFRAPDFGGQNGFDIGCAVLGPQTDLAEIEEKYGLEKLAPICGENMPMPVDMARLK